MVVFITLVFIRTCDMPNSVKVFTAPATSTPVLKTFTQTDVSVPFKPDLGREIYLTLSGTWTGSIQVQRSFDDGKTWNNVTVAGGIPWLLYTINCDEIIATPTDAATSYRLSVTLSSGSVSARLAQ
jgi:hypothetical protein